MTPQHKGRSELLEEAPVSGIAIVLRQRLREGIRGDDLVGLSEARLRHDRIDFDAVSGVTKDLIGKATDAEVDAILTGQTIDPNADVRIRAIIHGTLPRTPGLTSPAAPGPSFHDTGTDLIDVGTLPANSRVFGSLREARKYAADNGLGEPYALEFGFWYVIDPPQVAVDDGIIPPIQPDDRGTASHLSYRLALATVVLVTVCLLVLG